MAKLYDKWENLSYKAKLKIAAALAIGIFIFNILGMLITVYIILPNS